MRRNFLLVLSLWVVTTSALATEKDRAERIFFATHELGMPHLAETVGRIVHVQAIGPLYVRDMEWFRGQLAAAKLAGIEAISIDVWWGLVQGSDPNKFDWSYYRKIFAEIRRAGLKIVPILSNHACGPGFQDGGESLPLPEFILKKGREKGLFTVSEHDNVNEEAIGPWGSEEALPDFRRYWTSFRDEFKEFREYMPRIIVGTGPAGELVMPAYHAQDGATQITGFKKRGAFQARSWRAQADLKRWLKAKYHGDLGALNRAWATSYHHWDHIHGLDARVENDAFLTRHEQYTPRGQDLIEWYHSSLMEHGVRLLSLAADIFSEHGFDKIPLGPKIPGVYWFALDKMAQITAGLVSTAGEIEPSIYHPGRRPVAWRGDKGAGCRSLFEKLIVPLRAKHPKTKWTLEFTAGELPNLAAEDLWAYGLTDAYAALANEYDVPLYLENSLMDSMNYGDRLRNFSEHLRKYRSIAGLSLLRLEHALGSHVARDFIRKLIGGGQRPTAELACPREMLVLGNSDAIH